jgi:hypothetical protein
LALNPVAAPPTPLEEFAPPPAAPEKAVAPPAAVPTKSVAPPPAPAPRAAGVAAPSAAKSPRFVVLSGKEVFRTEADRGARFSVTPTSAQGERAVHLYFSFVEGTWGLCALDIREDLSRYSRVQFVFKGDGPANTLEFKLVDSDGTNVGEVWPRRTTKSGWTVVDLRLKDLAFLGGTDPVMDWTRVRRIYFAVSKRPGDAGGKGRVTIRGLSFS